MSSLLQWYVIVVVVVFANKHLAPALREFLKAACQACSVSKSAMSQLRPRWLVAEPRHRGKYHKPKTKADTATTKTKNETIRQAYPRKQPLTSKPASGSNESTKSRQPLKKKIDIKTKHPYRRANRGQRPDLDVRSLASGLRLPKCSRSASGNSSGDAEKTWTWLENWLPKWR